MNTQIKVAGYIRVSTAIQASEGESLTTQKQQIQDFARQKGWELTNIYADEGLSGTKIEYRTQLQQMIKDAKQGHFSVILFSKLSRFARNAREYQNMSYELEQHGVNLVSIKENIDPTTKTGKMIAGILSLFAQWEHETIKEQMYENKMIRWKENRTFMGVPPFGYTWNKGTKQLEINEQEAEIYRRIVSMYIDTGMGMRDIALKFNTEGLIITKHNRDGAEYKRAKWNCAGISYILKNPCYYGHYVVNTVVYEDGKNGAGTKRTKTLKPESENISFPIPSIISKVEWDKIQQTSQFRKVQTKRTGEYTSTFFLRNVLVCNRCGGKMNAKIGSKRKDGFINRYYTCYNATTIKKNLDNNRDQKCDLPHIKAKKIESAVWADILVMFALNPKKSFGDVFNSEKHKEKILNFEQTVLNLESELAAKKKARERIYKLLEIDGSDVNEVYGKLKLNKDELITIESNLTEVKHKLSELLRIEQKEKERTDFLTNNKKQFATLRKEIRELSLEDRKTLVECMLSEPIKLDYEDAIEGEHGGGPCADYKLHFNTSVIQRFIDEGKILRFNKDSSYDTSAFHP